MAAGGLNIKAHNSKQIEGYSTLLMSLIDLDFDALGNRMLEKLNQAFKTIITCQIPNTFKE